MHIGFDCPDRTLDDQLDADSRRQMKNHITLVNEFGQSRLIGDGINRVVKAWMLLQMRDILNAAG